MPLKPETAIAKRTSSVVSVRKGVYIYWCELLFLRAQITRVTSEGSPSV